MAPSAKITTGKCRLSFPNLFTPRTDDNGENPKYGLKLLIPKSDKATIRALRNLQKEALAEGIARGINRKKLSGEPGTGQAWDTIHDGDDSEAPEDHDHWTVNVSSKRKPAIVDRNVQPILDADEVYSGCYARVSVNFYAFNTNGNRGVAVGLNHIQKIADGEPLGGARGKAENEFDDWDDDLGL